jgi:hypothetical protein
LAYNPVVSLYHSVSNHINDALDNSELRQEKQKLYVLLKEATRKEHAVFKNKNGYARLDFSGRQIFTVTIEPDSPIVLT